MSTKEEIKKRIEIMQAWVDGAEIETSFIGGDEWSVKTCPSFDSFNSLKYRIKPKPREVWVNEYNDGIQAFSLKSHAKTYAKVESHRLVKAAVKYREVVEDE